MLTCIIIGLIVGGITLLILLSQLKTVVPQNQASNYIKKNSLHLTEQKDFFLFKQTEKTPRQNAASNTPNAKQ
ncbi:MAG: hypothetical protein MJ071_03625 [Oscillospiraceae bacterium]|nr:hypothetical protein [Oscillospiraceae bacterium]